MISHPIAASFPTAMKEAGETSVVKTAMAAVVHFDRVRFSWDTKQNFTLAIDQFDLKKGERLLIIGPSGGGKSTFLSLLAGISAPSSGRIDVLGTDLTTLSTSARDRFRAEHFGIIFQMFNLLPYGSVIDNVLLPLNFSVKRRARALAKGGGRSEAMRLLESLGLERSLIEGTSAANLSVGQQQRVAAARALIGSPELIVADEPTSALDRNRQEAFLDLLFAVVAEAAASLVMVSHDESLGHRFDRVVNLADIATARRHGVP